jgi:two-component system, NtrC family, response regulator AtoC
MTNVLLIDDDAGLAHFLRRALEKQGYAVHPLPRAEGAFDVLSSQPIDLVLLDNRLPGVKGIDFLAELRKRKLPVPVILMTAYGTTDLAIRAVKEGAFDYLVKPFDLEELLRKAAEAIEATRLVHEKVQLPGEEAGPGSEAMVLLGNGRPMQAVFKLIGHIAESDAPVLIRGETGTGKELVARAIFAHGKRADRPFVAVNCAAIPEQLLESELFGHERGSFTGADRKRVGKFEQASGGTILLDEIGDMSLATQAKILRVLQQGELTRLGSNDTVHVDVRIVAATNRDLEADIAAGRFREDLFYRLNGVTVQLPPLRERGDDLILLARHFAEKAAREVGRPGPELAPETLEKLKAYLWPGNVRQLANVMRRAVLLRRAGPLVPGDIDFGPLSGAPATEPPATEAEEESVRAAMRRAIELALDSGQTSLYPRLRELLERDLLSLTLARLAGNQVQAARTLGIARSTLWRWMQDYPEQQ